MAHPRLLSPLLCVCLLAICCITDVAAGETQWETAEVRPVIATLAADTTAIAPGKPFTVGVRFEIQPAWNIYWQFGGDIAKPTVIQWELPEGFTAGPLQWSLPEAHQGAMGAVEYVYFQEAFVFAEITPPAQLPTGPLDLKAKVSWQMCGKGTCQQGNAELASPMDTGEPKAANAALFSRWRNASPKSASPPFTVKWDRTSSSQFALLLEGLPKESSVEIFPLPPGEVKPGDPQAGPIAENGTRMITFPIKKGGGANLPWRGVIATRVGDGPRESWAIQANGAPVFDATSAASPALPAKGLFTVLWSSFLGGLILNLMPCVLPVIALKIFGFVRQAGEEPRRVFRLGLAYIGGVFAFFLGLAALTVALKTFGIELNWGFQFQNPIILGGLIVLVFIFALNLLGVFEVVLAGGAASRLGEIAGREGYSGAFLHGMFTTLLGASCTAPFLGTALGFAFVAPAPVVFAIFSSIAAGMSLPYFLLTAKPAWLCFLPKPGAWMERLKQLTGFIMLGVVIWLLGVYGGGGEEITRLTALGGFLLVVAVACWIYGFHERRIVSWAIIATLLGCGSYVFLWPGSGEHIAWEPWSEKRVLEATANGQTVFVDFTATWCPTCHANENFVLETSVVRTALAQQNILPLKADFSKEDPVILAELHKYGQPGVPAYLLCRAGEARCKVLPSILTQSLILDEIEQLK